MDNMVRIEQIYRQYAPSLIRRIKWYFPNDSFLVADILQELFISLIKKKKKLDLGERIFAYLHNAVRFKCRDIIKKNKKHNIIINSELIDITIDTAVDIEKEIITHSSYKENFEDVAVPGKVKASNIKEWQYKEEHTTADNSRHLSPFAEEFHSVPGLGENEKQIHF